MHRVRTPEVPGCVGPAFPPVLVPRCQEGAVEGGAEMLPAARTAMAFGERGCFPRSEASKATKHKALELFKTLEDFQYLLFLFWMLSLSTETLKLSLIQLEPRQQGCPAAGSPAAHC